MKQYIGCDSHSRYSVFVSVDEKGRVGTPVRVDHGGRGLRDYLATLEKGTPVAVEASGGWYWFMDELEKAGLDARLANPLEAKHRMGGKNKTDKLDAQGLAILLRNGTLPEVWIPPAGLRDPLIAPAILTEAAAAERRRPARVRTIARSGSRRRRPIPIPVPMRNTTSRPPNNAGPSLRRRLL